MSELSSKEVLYSSRIVISFVKSFLLMEIVYVCNGRIEVMVLTGLG